MNRQEFLDWLATQPTVFYIDQFKNIRTAQSQCPLQILTGKDKAYIGEAIVKKGMTEAFAYQIIMAADGDRRSFCSLIKRCSDLTLRRDMLAALKLQAED